MLKIGIKKPLWQGDGVVGATTAAVVETPAPASLITDPAAADPSPASGAQTSPESLITNPEKPAEVVPQPLLGDAFTVETLSSLLGEGATPFAADDPMATAALELINGATSKATLAEGLVKLSADLRTSLANEVSTAWNEQQEASRQAIREAFKGETLAPALASANEVAKTYGGDDMIKLLQETGTGNSPVMLNFLLAVKKAIPGEGGPITGSPTGVTKDRAERMFQTKGAK